VRKANIAVVKEAFEAFNRRDADAFILHASPGIVWLPALATDRASYEGHRGIREYFDLFAGAFSRSVAIIDECQATGDLVLVLGRLIGVAPGTPALPTAAIYEFGDDGKITRVRGYTDKALAIREAHLA
jgi:ketosteroid isomerase-like protein